MGGLKVIETQRSFCFLLDFSNFFFQEDEGEVGVGGREGDPQGNEKGIKTLKVTTLVSIKKPVWMKKPRYAVNSS